MFIYFIPGYDNNQWEQAVDKYGLHYAFDEPPKRSMNTKGPAEGAPRGCLLSASTSQKPVSYQPDQQTWRQFDGYSVGYWNDAKPTEESLRKPQQLVGQELELNGERWLVPRAIQFEEYQGQIFRDTPLSRYIDCDEKGRPVKGEVEREFAPLLEMAVQYLEILAGTSDMLVPDYHLLAAKSLGFNYHISMPEASMLQLLTEKLVRELLNIVSDYDSLMDLKKKLFPDVDLSTTHGVQADAQATDQPLQTSI